MPRNAATQNNNTENMEQQVPFKVTITEHNPERGVLANADVNVAVRDSILKNLSCGKNIDTVVKNVV